MNKSKDVPASQLPVLPMHDYEGYFNVPNPVYMHHTKIVKGFIKITAFNSETIGSPNAVKADVELAWFKVFKDREQNNKPFVCIDNEVVYIEDMKVLY